jgi:hypothetical protein
MTADYHKDTPQTVRMPDGMKARVKAAAKAGGETVNAFIVGAIEEKLVQRGTCASTRPATTAQQSSPPLAAAAHPRPEGTGTERESPADEARNVVLRAMTRKTGDQQ